MKYAVIYLWRGERHQLLQSFETVREARAAAHEVQMRGFHAWVEELG